MKKLHTFATLFLCYSGIVNAQITIDQSDMLIVGTKITMSYDTSASMLNLGNPGSGQTWDFSSLTVSDSYNSDVLSPSGQIKSNYFPTATAAFNRFSFITQYYENEVTGLKFLGSVVTFLDTVVYSLNYNYLEYPASLGSKHTAQSDVSLTGTYFIGIDPDGPGPHPLVDSIGTASMEIFESHIDAEGALKTPVAEYNALRQFTKLTNIDSSYMHANGEWQPMTQTMSALLNSPVALVDTTYSYAWLAKGMSLPVMTIEYEPLPSGNDISIAQWSSLIPTGIHTNEVFFEVQTFPNPVFDKLQIVNNEHLQLNYTLLSYEGTEFEQGSLEKNTSIDVSYLPSGMYFLKLQRNNSIEVRKITKN